MEQQVQNEIQLIVASRAIVIDNTQRLLLVSDNGNFWYLPGGYQEVNEITTVTAERETYEETGLHVVAQGVIFMSEYVDYEHYDPAFRYVHKIEHYVKCQPLQQEQVAKLEDPTYTWHDCDEDLVKYRRFFTQAELMETTYTIKPEFLRHMPITSLLQYPNIYMEFEHRLPQEVNILQQCPTDDIEASLFVCAATDKSER